MANRIVDGAYIIDTASANVSLPIGSKFRISSIRIWGLDTSAKAIFTGANTTDAICVLSASWTPTALSGVTDEANLGGAIFSELKIPTLTACTAWIYYS